MYIPLKKAELHGRPIISLQSTRVNGKEIKIEKTERNTQRRQFNSIHFQGGAGIFISNENSKYLKQIQNSRTSKKILYFL